MLFRSLNDARYPYTYVTSVYAGKPTEDPERHNVTGPEKVIEYLVMEMEEDGQLRGRNVTINIYTSFPLMQWLFEKGITMSGTIQRGSRRNE